MMNSFIGIMALIMLSNAMAFEDPVSVEFNGFNENAKSQFSVRRVENPFSRIISDDVIPSGTVRPGHTPFTAMAHGKLVTNAVTRQNFVVTDNGLHRVQNHKAKAGEDEPKSGTIQIMPEETNAQIKLPWRYNTDGFWVQEATREEHAAIMAGRDPLVAIEVRRTSDPLIFDTDGDKIRLSGPSTGIRFDVNADGIPEYTGWVSANDDGTVDDGFLCLDRNGDGTINNGTELFGMNVTNPNQANGFVVLAIFDANADKTINSSDAVWPRLRIWLDGNLDGRSQTAELFSLDQLGITSIDLNFESNKLSVDTHGNSFRERSTFKRRARRGGEFPLPVVNVWFNSYNP